MLPNAKQTIALNIIPSTPPKKKKYFLLSFNIFYTKFNPKKKKYKTKLIVKHKEWNVNYEHICNCCALLKFSTYSYQKKIYRIFMNMHTQK